MTVRVIDTKDTAEGTFKTFYARKSEREIDLPFGWPKCLQEVGVGRAEMYRSNKWKKDRSETEDYKHVVEGTRTVYVEPGFLVHDGNPSKKLRVYGPMVEFEEPMPRHITQLGPLLGIQLCLYEQDRWTPNFSRSSYADGGFRVPTGDKGLFEVTVARAMLGAAKHPKTGETFLFVYTNGGVHMILAGDKLTIEKDGIAG